MIQKYGHPLEAVMPLKQLGSLITATDYDWAPVTVNLQKAHKIWYRGSIPQNVRLFLPGIGSGNLVIWRGYVGGESAYWTAPEELP